MVDLSTTGMRGLILTLTWHHDEALHVVLQPGPLAAGQRVTAADGAAHLALASPGHLRSHVIIITILSEILSISYQTSYHDLTTK